MEKTMSKVITKKERFKKYANLRLGNIKVAFDRLSKITNKESYDYSEVDINKICDYIDVMAEDCKTLLRDESKQDNYFK